MKSNRQPASKAALLNHTAQHASPEIGITSINIQTWTPFFGYCFTATDTEAY
jgi:hypothetical protein